MKTTLNKIRAHSPCKDGWEKLLKSLNKTGPDDEPLDLLTILDSNGLDDTLWCLRAVEGHEKEIRLYAVWCARQVQHLMKDDRSIEALDIAENYANGLASEKELAASRDAANAAWAAAWSAANAARAATWAATSAAASAAAWDATSAATSAAAWAANAAWAATWAAANAATNAANAARAATWAASAAWAAASAASAAIMISQEKKLREILLESDTAHWDSICRALQKVQTSGEPCEIGSILRAQEQHVASMAEQARYCRIVVAGAGLWRIRWWRFFNFCRWWWWQFIIWREEPLVPYGVLPKIDSIGLAVNTPMHISEVGHELANQSGTFGLVWYLDAENKVRCSLRSNGDYDVSATAKAFGGRGHRNAAGFETDIETLMGWLK